MNSEKTPATLSYKKGAETAEEIIGVLTAISVVSKRMARKLALLEQRSAEKEEIKSNADGKTAAIPTDAN